MKCLLCGKLVAELHKGCCPECNALPPEVKESRSLLVCMKFLAALVDRTPKATAEPDAFDVLSDEGGLI